MDHFQSDQRGNITYPYECKHSAPPCPGCESWSQFDPERGSLMARDREIERRLRELEQRGQRE